MPKDEVKDLTIKDDVLAPEPDFVFEFTGKNPSKIVKDITDVLMDAYLIKGKNFYSRELKWGAGGDEITFYGNWMGKEGFDAYSSMYIELRVIGKENKESKEGKVTIRVYPYINTKVPMKSSFHKLYWIIWKALYYDKKRRSYITAVRSMTAEFKKVLIEKYGIGVKVT